MIKLQPLKNIHVLSSTRKIRNLFINYGDISILDWQPIDKICPVIEYNDNAREVAAAMIYESLNEDTIDLNKNKYNLESIIGKPKND